MRRDNRAERAARVATSVDWILIGMVAVAAGAGLLVLQSITRSDAGGFVTKQAIWLAVGLPVMIAAAVYDYTRLRHQMAAIYVVNLALLAAIVVFGHSALGAQRWISIAGMRFQPSEFAKIAIIISLAAYMVGREEVMSEAREIAACLLHVAPVFLLILLQPDLGTAMVVVAIVGGMLVAGGARPRHLLILLLIGILLVGAVLQFHILKDYQVKRLVVFLNPDVDPLGSGYNLRQSMIAVGSGRLQGKGLFSGTQSRLSFLPIRHTDFVFAVLAEELGFVGAAGLVAVFIALVARAFYLASAGRNRFGVLIGAGIATMWGFQGFVNMGMTIGIMPVTGIPLPFVSYGGSSILSNMLAVGLLLSIGLHRFTALDRIR